MLRYFAQFTPDQAAEAFGGLADHEQRWVRDQINSDHSDEWLRDAFDCPQNMLDAIRAEVKAGS